MITTSLIQLEHGKNHDADVALREEDAFRIVADNLNSYAGIAVARDLFISSDDHHEPLRAAAAKARFYYTIERRVFT